MGNNLVYILNRQEKIINILNNSDDPDKVPYFDDVLTQSLSTGADTYKFSTIFNDKNSGTILVGNKVAIMYEGEFLLFQIVSVDEIHSENMEIEVYCESAGLSLINNVCRKTKLVSSDIKRFLETILQDTEWNVGFIDMSISNSLDVEIPTASVYSIIQNNIKNYGAEIRFRCELNNGRISRKYVDAFSNRGRYSGQRFEFEKNIKGLTRSIDSTELYTALIGEGKNGLDFKDIELSDVPNKPIGADFVYDQEAFNLYNHNGYHLMGVYKYETESKEELLRATYKKLQECKKPKITYDVNVALLNEDVKIGDTVNIIDRFFNPPLFLQARVDKLETSLSDKNNKKCTLSNFVEVSSNINADLLNQIKDFVNNSLSDKFPVGTENIQNGAVTGEKIYENSITTDHLMADTITADKIQANAIQTKHLSAGSITAESAVIAEAAIISANIQEAAIESAHIKDAAIGTAQIEDAAITNAKIGKAAIGEANIQNASIVNAHIKDLSADKITAGDIDVDRLTASVIQAINLSVSGKIEADKIDVDSLVVDNIDAGKITTGYLNSDRIEAGSITASKLAIVDMTNLATLVQDKKDRNKVYLLNQRDNHISDKYVASDLDNDDEFLFELYCKTENESTSIQLNAYVFLHHEDGTISYPNSLICNANEARDWIKKITTVNVGKLSKPVKEFELVLQIPEMPSDTSTENWLVKQVVVRRKNNGKLIVDGSISADKIKVNAITSEKISANSIEAGHIKANSITTEKISANAITAEKVGANQIEAKHLKARTITADKITSDTINAIGIEASKITAQDIEAGKIKVGNINITDGTISGAKISSASITNAQIKDATIESAKIKEINAEKISAGTFDVSKVLVSSSSGNLTIRDNTIQIKDNQPTQVTRVQIGKDATNNYGIIVTNAKGQAIFDSDKGILIPDGLGSGVVSEDKIIDGCIDSSKLNVDELFVGENAFISKLKAVEIDASNITTGKISGERIDINGLVSFEAFDESLQHVFDVQGDKTYINGGMIATNTIKADKIDLLSGFTVQNQNGTLTFAISKEGTVEVNGLLKSGNYEPNVAGYRISPDGNAELNQATIRGSVKLPNAGITDELTTESYNGSPVRIWAGETFDNRETAPFRVTQKGDVFATNAIISGKMIGDLDSGKVHIHNNEIVINSVEKLLSKDGRIISKSVRDYLDNPHIRLGAGQSFINTDLLLGSNKDKKVEFLNDDRKFNLINTEMEFTNDKGNIRMGYYTKDESSSSYKILSLNGSAGGHHNIKYEDKFGGLIFESLGSTATPNGESQYDFKFEKSGSNADVEVKIQGNIEIGKKIKNTQNNIEQRMKSDGIYFYAV